MSKKNNIPQVKNEEQYEALRDKGYSKQKAARIANTLDSGGTGKSRAYKDSTKEELYEKAKTVGIRGRSKMSKQELIDALRSN